MINCPVCDTENKDDAIECECCGERLAPPKPGEEVAPEQMMAASLQAPPSSPPPTAPPTAPPRAGFAPIDDEFASLTAAPPSPLDDAAAKAKLAALAAAAPAPAAAPAVAPAVAAPAAEAPRVLYSSLSGKAYPPGSPEHKEGFGPMGEELVATPPAGLDMRSTIPVGSRVTADDVIQEMKTQPMAAVAPPEPAPAPAAQPPLVQPAAIAPQAPVVAPVAQAGAKITVFHQRQPVHTHLITTDEVLLGRKDVRADIDPDVDLTPWDDAGHVSRKHAYLYRQNRVYTLYAVSNGGVQLNKDLLEIGDKRELRDGDVIILAGVLAIKFEKL